MANFAVPDEGPVCNADKECGIEVGWKLRYGAGSPAATVEQCTGAAVGSTAAAGGGSAGSTAVAWSLLTGGVPHSTTLHHGYITTFMLTTGGAQRLGTWSSTSAAI